MELGGTFVQAFHSQPVNENNQGHVSVNRWHIADNIPFQKAFEGALEKYFKNERPTLYAGVSYWYLEEGGNDPYPSVPVSERIGWWWRPAVYFEPDAIEGESLMWLHRPLHRSWPDSVGIFGDLICSGNTQYSRLPEAVGETLELGVPVKQGGKYHVLVRSTKSPEYGTFRISLNGKNTGVPVDSYAPVFTAELPVDLGIFDLQAGMQTLTVTVTGKNPASKGYGFGLDYVKFIAEN